MSKSERELREELERDIKDSEYYKGFGKTKPDNNKSNKYQRECKGIHIDVYDVLNSFKVVNPATAHAVKKLLASGQRGYKGVKQDLEEARDSIVRAIELEE